MKKLIFLSILSFGLLARAQSIDIEAGFFGVKLNDIRIAATNAIIADYTKNHSLPKKHKIEVKDLALNSIKKSENTTTLSMTAVGPVINDSGIPDVCSLDITIITENDELKSLKAANVECSPYD